MKRFTAFLTFTLLATTSMLAEHVTPETARKVASTFLNNNGAKSDNLIDISKTIDLPNLYIFTTEDSFVILSADDCVKPILGYSTENPFGTETIPENVRGWLEDYENYIAETRKSGKKAEAQVEKEWEKLIDGNVTTSKTESPSYLVKTQWDQFMPFNLQCPGTNTATGCVATAMAQIMKYWNYPTTGFSSHSYTPTSHPEYGELTVNFGENTYDWDNMIDSYLGSYTEEQANAVAKLMYHCGVSVDMSYGHSSSAITSDAIYALQTYFNYCPTAEYVKRADYVDENGEEDLEQWKNLLIAELTATPPRPIQYRGNNTGRTGHSFICDGYDETTGKFHFNWGWSGDGDGWFDIPDIPSYPDNHGAIIGIQPITYSAQVNGLSATVNGHNVSLIWEGVQDASSYNVYRNHTLVGNTESTTFIDSELPLGEYFYYVRCVDNEGNVSLPSNLITATIESNITIDALTIEHLKGNYNNGVVSLQWEAPYRLNYIDYYQYDGIRYYTGQGEPIPFYWGARFISSMLSEGTSLTSISTYFYTSADYSAFVYQCTGGVPSGEPIATIPTNHYPSGWTTLPINNIALDADKDLWVIFKSTDIPSSTLVAPINNDNGNYYSDNGTSWNHFNPGYSFFITAGLSNGDFNFTLYDNGESMQENINTSTITLTNVATNIAHQYTIKAVMGNEVTPPSNKVGFTFGTATLSDLDLGDNDKMTIAEDSQLTVNGTLSDVNADNLILEDGAQLINDSEGVKATVKKSIQPYTDGKNDGWNLIASPITESLDVAEDVNGLVRNTYDLYVFDQTGTDGKEWRNYEAQSFTTIDNKVGYLYSNSNETTISFAGTLAGIVTPTTITRNDNVEFKGFNLIGNPYPCEVYTSNPFYTLQYNAEDDKTSFVLGQNPIPPCTAILVQAQTNEESVSFSKTPLTKDASITMRLSKPNMRSTHHIDQVRISFEAGCQLSKYTWGNTSSTIYIPQNGQNFAVAYANGANEMPINIHVAQNGTYTLYFEKESLNLSYLQLIDNLTGKDVDLMAMPSYTFEAKTTDYESRFRLVFRAKDGSSTPSTDSGTEGSETFAYISNGNIIITGVGDAFNASLQVVDMMGRVVLAGDAINRVSTSGMTAGVYVLRLINGNDVKTQKIVIE